MGQTLREELEAEVKFMAEHTGGVIACRGVVERLSAILAHHPVPSGRTVRVRAAVATLGNGEYCASGYDDDTDEQRAGRARWCDDALVTFITADVPLPAEPVEVEGTVES